MRKRFSKMTSYLDRGLEPVCVMGAILLVMLVVAAYTGQWPWRYNFYNSYVLQAQAWLQGRLDLGQDYSWLELAIRHGKYYVSFPPFPSYVMLPFAAVLGDRVPDNWIAIAVTMLGAWYALRVYREAGGNSRHAAFWVLFLYLGTGYLFIAMNGYVWFIAQTMCFTLSMMAIYYAVRGRGGVSLTLWAGAVGCRPMVALYFPLLAYILWRSWHLEHPGKTFLHMVRKKLYWAIGPCVLAASYMVLNTLRFGNPLEFGHNYLPEFLRAEHGQFSLTYFAENATNLLRLPSVEDGKVVLPRINGVAFWLVNPLIVVAMAAWLWEMIRQRRSRLAIDLMLPAMSLGYVFILCCHRTLGGWQFGDRYLLDLMPYLFFGLVLWMPTGDRFQRLCMPLMIYGVALSTVGTIMTYL